MAIKDDMEDVQEAVINQLITDNGLDPLSITDGTVTLTKLGSDVDLGQVNDLAVTTAKIADDAVTLAKLGSDVDLGQVNDGAVTPAKLSQAYLPLTGGSVTGNVTFGDNDKAIFGAGSDLHIYHDGINSYIADTGTGRLRLRGNDRVDVYGGDGTKQMAKFRDGAEVALYHNNALKLATTSFGVNVTGSLAVDTITNASSSTDVTIDTNFDIVLDAGGHIKISNIPTSASGLSTGTIYSDGGTLKIV